MSSSRTGEISATRRRILGELKRLNAATIASLADSLGVSGEAVRQHLTPLVRGGWVKSVIQRTAAPGRIGRPAHHYSLTEKGENLFPKNHRALVGEIVDAVEKECGAEAVRRVFGRVAADVIARWRPRLGNLPIGEQVRRLREIYFPNDEFMEVLHDGNGGYRLIERNCPYLALAQKRQEICSVTVHCLSRLLDRRVVREERFQHGDGRCTFHVTADPAPAADDALRQEPPTG